MKKLMYLSALGALAGLSTVSEAHIQWINVVPELDNHVVISVNYGDMMPGSELLAADWWPMHLAAYEVIDPNGARTSLGVPNLTVNPKSKLPSGLSVQAGGDTGVRKFLFGPETRKGTYMVAAESPLTQFVQYRDKSGASRYSDQKVEQLEDVAEVTSKYYDMFFMKAVFTVGGWTEPQTVGHPLEIVPLTDLSEARVGDVVRFKVLLHGKAYDSGPESELKAFNTGLGDRWGYVSDLKYGEGQFRLTHAGIWRVDASFTATTKEMAAYKDKKLPDSPMRLSSTFVFNVKH